MTKVQNLLALSLLAAACTPGKPEGNGFAITAVSGSATVGTPIFGGTVTLYEVTEFGEKGGELKQTDLDENGDFAIELSPFDGPTLACVSGRFVDPASNGFIQMGDEEFCALSTVTTDGTNEIHIHPWTHLAAELSKARMRRRNLDVLTAINSARDDLKAFLACSNPRLDIFNTKPHDPTIEGGVAGLSSSSFMGVLLAGLSGQGVIISEQMGITTGLRIQPVSTTRAYTLDIEDGRFDGQGLSGQVAVEGWEPGPDSLRTDVDSFPQGLRKFLNSERNLSGFKELDFKPLLECLPIASEVLFSGASSGTLDTTAPEITFVTPSSDAILSQNAPLLVIATDANTIVRLEPTAGQDFIDYEPAYESGGVTRLEGTLDLIGLESGTLPIVIETEDESGNISTKILQTRLDFEAPTILLESPSGGAASGQIIIRAIVSDPQGVDAFELINPPGLENTAAALNTWESIWDTTQVYDGPFPIEFSATDGAGREGTQALVIDIDNLEPGRVEGYVSLESPIHQAEVSAYAFENSVVGNILGQGETDEGLFSFELSDSYAGPVLLLASLGTYIDTSTGESVPLGTSDELKTVIDYTPSEEGTVIEGLAINALTTLATTLAEVKAGAEDTEFNEALASAFTLFGEHLRRPDAVDVARTFPRNFSVAEEVADFDAVLAGLFHVGLSRLGAEVSFRENGSVGEFRSADVLALLIHDLGDGLFNGENNEGDTIFFSSRNIEKLETNTLRWILAEQIDLWLRNTAIEEEALGQNMTSLGALEFASPGGFFDTVSENTSMLFGNAPVILYDRDGPEIEGSIPTSSQYYPLNETITLSFQAIDPAGVQSLVVLLNGEPAGEDIFEVFDDRWQTELDTTELEDGEHDIEIIATDLIGNVNQELISIHTDNTEPVVQSSLEALTNQSEFELSVTSSENHETTAVARVYIDDELSSIALTPSSNTTLHDIGVECNESYEFRIEVEDTAGNIGRLTKDLYCDDIPPTLEIQTSFYKPANLLEPDYDDATDSTVYLGEEGLESQAPLHTFSWTPNSTRLHKYFNRLDAESPNLPRLILLASDQAQASAGLEDSGIEVSYEYVIANTLMRQETELESSEQTQGTSLLTLPISYQSLHPNMATADSNYGQYIIIHLRDRAGNESTTTFGFKMTLYSPPVWVRDCQIDSNLSQYGVDNQGLEAIYTTNNQTDFFAGKLLYRTGLEENSLAPQSPIEINANQQYGWSGVTEARKEYIHSDWKTDANSSCGEIAAPLNTSLPCDCFSCANVGNCASIGDFHKNQAYWAIGGACNSGHKATSDEDETVDLSDPWGQIGGYTPMRDAFWNGANQSDRINLDGDLDYRIVLDNPSSPYLWSTSYGSIDAANTPEDRYRIHLDGFAESTIDIRPWQELDGLGIGEVRDIAMVPYLTEWTIRAQSLNFSAEHPDNPSITIPFVMDSSCQSQPTYTAH